MKKFTSIINLITTISKYGAIIMIVIRAIDFVKDELEQLDNKQNA